MAQETVVISMGGSILIPGKDDATFIRKLADTLRRTSGEARLVVVCGGGRIARYYASTGRELGGNERALDIMGIGATRLNAKLLAIALEDLSSTDIPLSVGSAVERVRKHEGEPFVLVMGGTRPGHTTDAVAAMLARDLEAVRVVNATSVDAVYSDDPRKNLSAERYDRLTIGKLGDLVYKNHGAGKSSVFDPVGVEIARKAKVDILVVDGRNLAELEKAILGKPFSGTYVSSRREARDPSRSGARSRRPRQSRGGAPPAPPSWIFYARIPILCLTL